jgi:hypothetical protein
MFRLIRSSLVRGTRSITQQAEHTATSNIHAHRRNRITTTKNHDTEAQRVSSFIIYNFKTIDYYFIGRNM